MDNSADAVKYFEKFNKLVKDCSNNIALQVNDVQKELKYKSLEDLLGILEHRYDPNCSAYEVPFLFKESNKNLHAQLCDAVKNEIAVRLRSVAKFALTEGSLSYFSPCYSRKQRVFNYMCIKLGFSYLIDDVRERWTRGNFRGQDSSLLGFKVMFGFAYLANQKFRDGVWDNLYNRTPLKCLREIICLFPEDKEALFSLFDVLPEKIKKYPEGISSINRKFNVCFLEVMKQHMNYVDAQKYCFDLDNNTDEELAAAVEKVWDMYIYENQVQHTYSALVGTRNTVKDCNNDSAGDYDTPRVFPLIYFDSSMVLHDYTVKLDEDYHACFYDGDWWWTKYSNITSVNAYFHGIYTSVKYMCRDEQIRYGLMYDKSYHSIFDDRDIEKYLLNARVCLQDVMEHRLAVIVDKLYNENKELKEKLERLDNNQNNCSNDIVSSCAAEDTGQYEHQFKVAQVEVGENGVDFDNTSPILSKIFSKFQKNIT